MDSWLPSRWTDVKRADLEVALAKWRKRLVRDPNDEHTWGDMAIQRERGRDVQSVEEHIRRGAALGFTFFVIDHLQKIRVKQFRGDVFTTADYVSETLDDLVSELNVTIVGLSQLNRNASRETYRKPTIYDLHGGTSMESNAAVVLLLDHSRYEMDPTHHHIGRTFILLAKNQMGPKKKEVAVLWNHAELSIREGLPDELNEWPKNGRSRAR